MVVADLAGGDVECDLRSPTGVQPVVYLVSDEAAWVTGAALAVDGGLTSGVHPS